MTQATVLVVEDDADLREALTDTLASAGFEVRGAGDGKAALACLERAPVSLVVSDVRMDGMDGRELLRTIKTRSPALPVLMMTAYGTVASAVEAMRLGAADYLVKPFEADILIEKVRGLVGSVSADAGELIASDARMRELAALAARVAATDATVLLSGESGTGKEVLARYIHRRSRRAAGPFVAINCAAIPENMLEATLFGYEKGAFTGAVAATPGKFEQAQGGTLLLDEISEMPLLLQAKLLRVLQEREVERLGSRKTITLDTRVLATTNRNLRVEVAAGRFREDLYYRLNVFPLAIPALRERPADIAALARHLLARHTRAAGRALPSLSATAEARLRTHTWPGNVRELDNLVQRALILQPGDVIDEADLHFEGANATSVSRAPRLDPIAEFANGPSMARSPRLGPIGEAAGATSLSRGPRLGPIGEAAGAPSHRGHARSAIGSPPSPIERNARAASIGSPPSPSGRRGGDEGAGTASVPAGRGNEGEGPGRGEVGENPYFGRNEGEGARGPVAVPQPLGTDAPATGLETLGEDLRSHEQRLILDALNAGSGSRKEAAARLGISPRTLRYKLARMREAGITV
jgi:two-component system response regulator FlrC